MPIEEWYNQPRKSSSGSNVWKELVENFPLVGSWTVWKIGNGRKVKIGQDQWMGIDEDYQFSEALIQSLHEACIFSLKDEKS
jgi:hypothetical protein